MTVPRKSERTPVDPAVIIESVRNEVERPRRYQIVKASKGYFILDHASDELIYREKGENVHFPQYNLAAETFKKLKAQEESLQRAVEEEAARKTAEEELKKEKRAKAEAAKLARAAAKIERAAAKVAEAEAKKAAKEAATAAKAQPPPKINGFHSAPVPAPEAPAKRNHHKKPAALPAETPQAVAPVAEIKAKDPRGRKPDMAETIRAHLREGKLTHDEIWAIVSPLFKLVPDKRYYIDWYWKEMTKGKKR
jgi:hypothetical protein